MVKPYFCIFTTRMKSLYILIFFLSVICSRLPAQDNPFVVMASQPYASYSEKLDKTVYRDIDLRDSVWAAQTANQMREAARITGSRKWTLEADFFEAEYRYHRRVYIQKPNQQQIDLLAEELIADLMDIVRQARKTGEKEIELRALYGIKCRYAYSLYNYEMSFRSAHELDKVLSTVSAEEFPLKPEYYFEIARLYYLFRDYETTAFFFGKVLETPEIAYRQRKLEITWNDLGLIYRNYYQDLNASDSCFNQILKLNPESPELVSPTADKDVAFSLQQEYELWSAIAKGNLGTNAYLRKEYDTAIPLLQYGMERSVLDNPYNYSYAAGKALVLTDIFLERDDSRQARHYIDIAYSFLEELRQANKAEGAVQGTPLRIQYYQTMSRYLRIHADYRQALLYADSAATMRTMFEDDFNLRKLHRAEQRIQQDKLEAEQLRSATYRRTAFIIAGFLLVILALTGLLLHFYRRKKIAYQELVKKNRQWANASTENKQPPSDKERVIIDEAHKLLLGGLYKDPELSLDMLADIMNVNRHVLSKAINVVTEKNFSQFVNDYRVKEAIRLLSIPHKTIYMGELYEQVGFNSRSAFYRIFKQVTGLSPREFRNNFL